MKVRSTPPPKPAAARLEALWGEEWRTSVTQPMGASGVLDFEGFHGLYEYTLSFGDLTCSGEIDLEKMSAEEYEKARRESSNGEVDFFGLIACYMHREQKPRIASTETPRHTRTSAWAYHIWAYRVAVRGHGARCARSA